MYLSSVNQSQSYTNPYQEDKTRLLALVATMEKALNTNKMDVAENTYDNMEKLLQKKTNKNMSKLQENTKQNFDNLSNALDSKDLNGAKEALNHIKTSIKENTVQLKTHSATEIQSQLTRSMIGTLYA